MPVRVPAADLDTVVTEALSQRLGTPEQLAAVLPQLAALTLDVIKLALELTESARPLGRE